MRYGIFTTIIGIGNPKLVGKEVKLDFQVGACAIKIFLKTAFSVRWGPTGHYSDKIFTIGTYLSSGTRYGLENFKNETGDPCLVENEVQLQNINTFCCAHAQNGFC